MAAKKRTTAKAPSAHPDATPPAQRTLGATLREACGGRKLGSTLTALLELAPRFDCLIVDADAVDDTVRRDYLARLGILPIGYAANGYFGPIMSQLEDPVDASPIAYADRQGLDPEVLGRDLAEFLSVWAFIPEFFEVRDSSAEDLDDDHAEFFADVGAEELAIIRQIIALPGVAALSSGAEVVRLLEDAPSAKFGPERGSAREVEARAADLFGANVGDAKLLIDIESVTVDGNDITVLVAVNAPRELAQKIVTDAAVDAPLRAFRAAMRAAYTDRNVKLAFIAIPAEGPPAEVARSLALALRHAKATALLRTLGLS